MSHPSSGLKLPLGFLAGIRLVVNSGHRLVYPFLPAIARGLGISLDQASLMVSARWAAGLATPVIVTMGGRGERRRRLIALGLALFSLGAVITAATNVYVGAFAGFVLMGISKPVYDVAAQAYLADRVPYEVRTRYIGMFELTWAGGLLVGAPAAGWLINAGDWTTPFWVIAVLTAAALAMLSRVLDSESGQHPDVSASLRWDRVTVAFLTAVALFSAAAEAIFVVLGAWLEDAFGLSVVTLGGVATLIAVAELTGEGGVAGFGDRIGKRTTVILGMAVASTGFLALAVLQSSLAAGIAATMVAFLGFEVSIVGSIPLASEMRPHARARFLSWFVVAMAIGRTLGAAAGTRFFAEFGVPGNAIAAAVANLIALGVFLTWVRERPSS